MKFNLLCLVALATGVLADDYTLTSMQEVHDATTKFKDTLNGWDGGYLSGIGIAKQSRDLYNTLKNAAKPPPPEVKAAQMSTYSVESEDQAFVVARNLVQEVSDTVDAAVKMKDKMEAIHGGKNMGSYIFNNLQDAAMDLGKVWPSLALQENQEQAQDLARQIDEHFARGASIFA